MKYTVLQIPFPETEEEKKIFSKYAYRSLDRIDYVHPEYYEKTYEGNIETNKTDEIKILEEIFTLLNINHPEDYKGHSLSVSDIVVLNDKKYYCNSYGWDEIEFETKNI